jgi:hypothetical protein
MTGQNTKKKSLFIIGTLLFLALTGWWVWVRQSGYVGETDQAELFSAVYGVMALFGGVCGLFASKKWGGAKSLVGKSTLFFALGLLAQVFGQVSYSAYTYLFHKEIPYPSVGDIGYFGSIILYIIGGLYLIKALSVSSVLKSKVNVFWTVSVPIALLAGSYMFFLNGYEFDFSKPLVVFLDLGYPFGQAIYIALGILAFLLSRKYLGGIMKPVILFLIFALFAQFVADFMFLYRVNRDLWETAGINDYSYLASYFVMTIALLKLGGVVDAMSSTSSVPQQSTQLEERAEV